VRPSAGSIGYVRLPASVSASAFGDDLVRVGLRRPGIEERLECLGGHLEAR